MDYKFFNTFEKLLNNSIVIDHCIKTIEEGITNDELVILLTIDDKEFFLHRNYWDSMLNICMEKSIQIENYEKCLNIKKLLEF